MRVSHRGKELGWQNEECGRSGREHRLGVLPIVSALFHLTCWPEIGKTGHSHSDCSVLRHFALCGACLGTFGLPESYVMMKGRNNEQKELKHVEY